MNLSDSKKKLALAGVVCGLIAACLAWFGNPANMAFCIACFIRDTAGALGMHQAEVVQYARPEIIGLVLGNGAHLLGEHLLGIYSSEAEVIQYGMMRLGVVSVTYCLCGMMDVVAGSVRGLGYSVLPMLVSFVGACLFRVIWIFTIFRWQHTLFMLYVSYPISWVLTLAAHLVCYLIVRRKVFAAMRRARLREQKETALEGKA